MFVYHGKNVVFSDHTVRTFCEINEIGYVAVDHLIELPVY